MTFLIVIIILAFIFDFINGFHDSANSIATIVATKVLTPLQAVLWAAFFNFMAYFVSLYIVGEFKIGNTIAKTVFEDFITLEVIFSGLLAAIIWNLATWALGIPSSSSHTLIGGFMGAALFHGYITEGTLAGVVNLAKVFPIILFIVAAPLLGMIISYFITVIIMHICKKTTPHKADRWFRKLQLLSSALFSLGHGANDAQKVMGIIGAAVIFYHVQAGDAEWVNSSNQFAHFVQEWWWVPLASFIVIGLGTMSGGWRIIKTMGTKITKVNSLEGVSAETAGAITLYISEHFGIPVSSTHTITGSILGVGITKRLSAVRWGVTVKLIWAWVLTIPVSALIAGLIYIVVSAIV